MADGRWQKTLKCVHEKTLPSAIRHLPSNQEGFTLAALLVILTIIAMVVAFTVPDQWSLVMGRERDRQTIFLMKQYARGIRAWARKNAGPPTSLSQLIEASRPRVLRNGGNWACPITGKVDDWILVPPQAIEAQGLPPGTPPSRRADGQGQQTGQGIGQTGGQPGRPGKLNKDASPKDYIGQFVAVRPNASGPSYISFNGADDYSEWVYTVQDLENEIATRAAALAAK